MEVGLNDESSVVDESILVDDVEYLSIDVDEAAGDEETRGSFNFNILPLLEKFDLFLWRSLLFELLQFLINILQQLVPHLLQFQLDLYSLLLYLLLQLIEVVCLPPEFYGLTWAATHLIELKAEVNMDSQPLQFIKHQLLDIWILKCVRVVDQTVFVFEPLRILSECPLSEVGWIGSDEVYPLWGHTPLDQTSYEGYGMWSTAVDCDVLWPLLPF